MKTLEEANREVIERTFNRRDTIRNGIACPNCGQELCDVDGCYLASNPPQVYTKCHDCNYRGTRFV